MDSHSFSEPELVSSAAEEGGDEDKTSLLTWRVHVLRKGVADPIDSLLINTNTLPPRKNRAGKVVWRLPDDPSFPPKFGVHEQKRLWELFKEQKKQRRKKPPAASSDPQDGSHQQEDDGNHGEGDISSPSGYLERTAALPGTPLSSDPARLEGVGSMSSKSAGAAVNGTHSSPVSPPPGFGSTVGIETLTLQETPTRHEDTPQGEPAMPGTDPDPTTRPINPPPALVLAAEPQQVPASSNNGHHSMYGNGAPALSTAATTTQSPSRGGHAEGPITPPSVMPINEQPRTNCFSLSSAQEVATFPQSLAGQVAHAFQRLIAVSGSPHGVSEWLSYYAPHARSTLIMGTAQAVAHTHEERITQWQSLAASSDAPTGGSSNVPVAGGKRWECNGWTAQVVDCGRPNGVPDVAERPHDVLVVLAGRTLQQHLLSFHLTLVLQHQQLHRGSQPPRSGYQISNEILALALLT